jgi:hypothetical protein
VNGDGSEREKKTTELVDNLEIFRKSSRSPVVTDASVA